MPRRALKFPLEVPAHLLLQPDDAGTPYERRLRRYARWRLEATVLLTAPEAYARRLHEQGHTVAEIREAIARLDVTKLSPREREREQVASMRKLDPEDARRTILRWLAKGRVRPRGKITAPPAAPVWVDRLRCAECDREEAVLRKIPLEMDYRGYCRRCRRQTRFLRTQSVRVPRPRVAALVEAWSAKPAAERSRWLLRWLEQEQVKPVPRSGT